MKRFEVPGHIDHRLGSKLFVRKGDFQVGELNDINRIRRAVRAVFPQGKSTERPIAYTLHVEETEIGFFQCRVETGTRCYVFNQPTLVELAVDVENHLSAIGPLSHKTRTDFTPSKSNCGVFNNFFMGSIFSTCARIWKRTLTSV